MLTSQCEKPRDCNSYAWWIVCKYPDYCFQHLITSNTLDEKKDFNNTLLVTNTYALAQLLQDTYSMEKRG